jgi:7-cyano-7-deazaguanine synthase
MLRMNKCVVVLSGGLDSATVAYWAKDKGFEVSALTFRYGQLARKETKHAAMISRELNIPLRTIDLGSLKDIYIGVTALCDKNIELTSAFSQPIIVPFRNAIFLSVAVSHAISVGAARVFYGAQGSDDAFYPDCRREFCLSFEKTARLGTGTNITVEAPLGNLTKPEVLAMGKKLGVPFDMTWSCYRNGQRHCGICESCVNRKKAFKDARMSDPTEYVQ